MRKGEGVEGNIGKGVIYFFESLVLIGVSIPYSSKLQLRLYMGHGKFVCCPLVTLARTHVFVLKYFGEPIPLTGI